MRRYLGATCACIILIAGPPLVSIARHGRRIEILLDFMEKRSTSRRGRGCGELSNGFPAAPACCIPTRTCVVRRFETDLRDQPRLPPMNTEKSVHGETCGFLTRISWQPETDTDSRLNDNA